MIEQGVSLLGQFTALLKIVHNVDDKSQNDATWRRGTNITNIIAKVETQRLTLVKLIIENVIYFKWAAIIVYVFDYNTRFINSLVNKLDR